MAGGALARDEIVPALRATRGGSPLEALLRLFWLQVGTPECGPLTDDLVAAGLAERSAGEVRATVHVEPLESVGGDSGVGYVVSDLKVRPGGEVPLRLDHVVGAGGASANLAQLVVHRPVDNALDLGTGSGVQALHLADRARKICATDVNPRALALAQMSFALSGLRDVELLKGSLLDPVHDRTFDLISLRKGGTTVRVEELRQGVEQPVGTYVENIVDGMAGGQRFSTGTLRTAAGVVQEPIGPPGAEDPERIVLRQTSGLRRAVGVGTVEAALAGVCDGTLPLEPLLDAIAELMGLPADDVRAHTRAVLPELVADGFFEIVG